MTSPANVITCNVVSDCGSGFLLADRLTVAPVEHAFTVRRAGAGSGAVTSNRAGIDCGATCGRSSEEGTAVVLRARRAGLHVRRLVGRVLRHGRLRRHRGWSEGVTAMFNPVPTGGGPGTTPRPLAHGDPGGRHGGAQLLAVRPVARSREGGEERPAHLAALHEAAVATVELRVDSRTARRLGLGERLGRISKTVLARSTPITVSLNATAKRRLKTVRSLKVRVLITARDAADNSARRLTVNLTLKRKRY